MHKTIKVYVTVRFALSEKLALKTLNVLIKNDVFRCFCAIFQNDRRSVAVRYGALKNSDKFALPIVSDHKWGSMGRVKGSLRKKKLVFAHRSLILIDYHDRGLE